MNDKKNLKRKRPLSCTPLLKFKRDENFIFDEKFMNDKLWLEKYNLKNLRKKWTQKVQTNFLIVDKKFESSSRNQDKNKIIYKDKIDEKELFIIPKFLSHYPNFNKKRQRILLYQKEKDKYNDKISYYLSNKTPWNNQTAIEVNKNNNTDKNYNIHEKIIKEFNIRNEYKNTNESKNINVKCYYYNNNYLQRKEKLEEMIKNYVEKMNEIVKEKYKKELKLKRHGKKLFIKIHVFKEIMKRYKKVYNELISKSKINIYTGQFLYRNQSDINILKNKKENEKEQENDIKNIYEELFIIINFLKENKNTMNEVKEETSLFSNYFDIFQKNQFLKNKDINYIKFLKNFGINDTDNINIINNSNKRLLINRKRNNSCLNLKNISLPKRKFEEFHITYYHQGTYYLFKEGEDEFHAWSCCMNEDKKSKGCCKKIERIPHYNYDIIGFSNLQI